MSAYELLAFGDANPEVKVNAANASLGQAYVFAERSAAHSGLTVGYGGGTFDVNAVADGTVAGLTDNTTNYLVVHRTTRAVTSSTATTNWNSTTTYGRMARAVFASGVLTWYDERYSSGGIFDRSGSSGGLLAANNLSDVANAATARTNLGVDTAIAAAVAGLSWKQAVRAATTAALTLATDFENGDTIDGVVLATGNRILIKNQASGIENGIYVVAASGAPARASDADSGGELVNASVYVSEGTTLADTQWTCTTNATITIGATSLAFAQLTSGSGVSDGDKGDITVSGSGATWTVDNTAITLAKIANAAANSKLLGSGESGSGSSYAELTLGTNLSMSGTTLNATGGSGTKTYAVFTPMTSEPPATNYGVLDTRNSIALLNFSDSTEWASCWTGIIPEAASLGSGLKVYVHWIAITATTNGVTWGAAFERMDTDLDADSFDTETNGTSTTSGTSGIVTTTVITCTTIDSVAAGDAFRLKIARKVGDGGDTMSGYAQIVAVEVRSAA